MLPQIDYAKSGDVNTAYQVIGQGPPDLDVIPRWVLNIEIFLGRAGCGSGSSRAWRHSPARFSSTSGGQDSRSGQRDGRLGHPHGRCASRLGCRGRRERAALFGTSEGGHAFRDNYRRPAALIMHASYARLTLRPIIPGA